MFLHNGANRPELKTKDHEHVSSSSPGGGTGAKSAVFDHVLLKIAFCLRVLIFTVTLFAVFLQITSKTLRKET